jgi:archaellum component FlaC
MKNFSLNKLALFSILCLIAQPLYAGNIRCWINNEDVFECGNYIPQEYSQKGFTEYDQYGRKIKEVEPAPTPEEIAEQKRQEEAERQYQEQLKKDRAFLDIFATERDIELAREAGLTSIDRHIQSIETIIEGLKRNIKDLENSYERSKDLNASKRQLETIQGNIDSVKKRLKDTEDTLQQMHRDRNDTNKEYDAYIQQYREIKRRSKAR